MLFEAVFSSSLNEQFGACGQSSSLRKNPKQNLQGK
jgi:hypothetical protein